MVLIIHVYQKASYNIKYSLFGLIKRMKLRWDCVTSLSHLYFSDVYLYLSLFWDSIPLLVEMQDLMWIVCLQETAISNAWYEVLSVLHLMAMLSLSQANLLLLPRTSADGYQPKVSEGQYLLQVIVNTDSLQYYLPFRV